MVWKLKGRLIVTKHGNGALFFFGGRGFRKFKMAAADDAPTCFLCVSLHRSTKQNPNLY